MKTIIHDLNNNEVKKIIFDDDCYVVNSNNCKNSCIGCFSCWIKHPKRCIYNDEFSNMSELIKNSDELIIISKSRYGCYSAQIKRVLERCIGYILPYFTIRNGMVHHESRYKDSKTKFKTIFYGDINDEDKKCLYDLTKANSINLNTKSFNVYYCNSIKEIIKCIH